MARLLGHFCGKVLEALCEHQLVPLTGSNCQEIKEFGNPIPERLRPDAECLSEALHLDLQWVLDSVTGAGFQGQTSYPVIPSHVIVQVKHTVNYSRPLVPLKKEYNYFAC